MPLKQLLVITGISFFSLLSGICLAQNKRVQLRKLNLSTIELKSDSSSVYPGMFLPLKVKFTDTKRRTFYSEGFPFGEVSNRELLFYSEMSESKKNGVRLIPDPYEFTMDSVDFFVRTQTKKVLEAKLTLPISYAVDQIINYSGSRGVDGSSGIDGTQGIMGSAPDYSSGGGGGRRGGNGGRGSKGQIGYDGTDGRDLLIDVQIVVFRSKEYIEVKIRSTQNELLSTHLLDPVFGDLIIDCSGGDGGFGGDGGRGGDRGEDMGAGTGVPGLGANGGDGGHGGAGGNVILRLTKDCEAYQSKIICLVDGGAGGIGGKGGEAGNPRRAVLGSQAALLGIDGYKGADGTIKVVVLE